MHSDEIHYKLISEKLDDANLPDEALLDRHYARTWVHRNCKVCFLVGLLLTSFALNWLQWMQNAASMTIRETGRSPYSGLPIDTRVTYYAHTDYWGKNETLADELWESLSADPVAVALSKEYQLEHGLPESSPFPWDDNKDLYFVKAFHDLHCLKVLRRAFVNYERGTYQDVSVGHVNHCLDAIRQDVMCKADDTPMPISMVKHSVGQGQQMECRNWDRLVAWTQAPEHNACYRIIDDYKPIVHSLERHAFCPEDSPYYPIMTKYFNKFGHKKPFSEGSSEAVPY